VTGSSFRFSLERVRSLREHAEELAKQELAGAIARRMESEQRVRTADAWLGGARDAQRGAASTLLGANDFVARQAYLERLERLRTAAQQELGRSDQNVASRRANVEYAMRERKVLDKLRDRQRAAHDAETARVEGIELDEIAGNLHRRAVAR